MTDPLSLLKMGAAVVVDFAAEILEEASGVLQSWADKADRLSAMLDPGEEIVPVPAPPVSGWPGFGFPDFELASQMIETAMRNYGWPVAGRVQPPSNA